MFKHFVIFTLFITLGAAQFRFGDPYPDKVISVVNLSETVSMRPL
jgi:hypothetical protein